VLPVVALDYRPALLGNAGISRAVRELARALAERDDLDIHLFAHSLARSKQACPTPEGARLHRAPIPGRSLPLLEKLGLGADRLAGGADVFHWTDYVHPPVSRARIVLTIHDLAFLRDKSWHGRNAKILRQRTARAASRANVIVVPSTATAADVRRLLPGAARTEVIPFGCDHVPTSAPPRPAGFGEDYVLTIGTIEPRKNHRTLLQAMRLLPSPGLQLVVVGRRGWECEDIAAELRAAEHEGLVRWIDDACDELAFALMAHARALVYPSLWEGFGFPPLEAMAMRVPVVAHDCAPLRELTEDAALLIDSRRPDDLAGAIERVSRDQGLRRQLVDAGRARAGCFSWRRSAAAHAALYREIAT